MDDDGADMYGGFAELFTDFPTSMLANITCSVKLKTESGYNETLK